MFCVSGSGDGKIEYPICRELSAMVLRLGRATVLRGRLHRGCWSDEMTVMFLLPMLVMLLPFQDTVLVDLVGGLSWGSCAPHAQANTNFWDLLGFPCWFAAFFWLLGFWAFLPALLSSWLPNSPS